MNWCLSADCRALAIDCWRSSGSDGSPTSRAHRFSTRTSRSLRDRVRGRLRRLPRPSIGRGFRQIPAGNIRGCQGNRQVHQHLALSLGRLGVHDVSASMPLTLDPNRASGARQPRTLTGPAPADRPVAPRGEIDDANAARGGGTKGDAEQLIWPHDRIADLAFGWRITACIQALFDAAPKIHHEELVVAGERSLPSLRAASADTRRAQRFSSPTPRSRASHRGRRWPPLRETMLRTPTSHERESAPVGRHPREVVHVRMVRQAVDAKIGEIDRVQLVIARPVRRPDEAAAGELRKS